MVHARLDLACKPIVEPFGKQLATHVFRVRQPSDDDGDALAQQVVTHRVALAAIEHDALEWESAPDVPREQVLDRGARGPVLPRDHREKVQRRGAHAGLEVGMSSVMKNAWKQPKRLGDHCDRVAEDVGPRPTERLDECLLDHSELPLDVKGIRAVRQFRPFAHTVHCGRVKQHQGLAAKHGSRTGRARAGSGSLRTTRSSRPPRFAPQPRGRLPRSVPAGSRGGMGEGGGGGARARWPLRVGGVPVPPRGPSQCSLFEARPAAGQGTLVPPEVAVQAPPGLRALPQQPVARCCTGAREAGGRGRPGPARGAKAGAAFGHERRCFCQRRHSRGGISHRRCNRTPAGASSRSARGESAANCTGVRVRGLLLTCAGADTRARCMRARLNEMLRAKCKRHSCPTPAAPDTVAWSLARAPRSAPALVIEAGSVRGPAAAAAAAAAELAPASVAALRECE
mmetsp:Transcript_2710/g.10839  ORF Transcript_2710/g.10839 Transcript_2710/m.10839 type:complete len:455 (-) Transcript_2710:6451-7815(-)